MKHSLFDQFFLTSQGRSLQSLPQQDFAEAPNKYRVAPYKLTGLVKCNMNQKVLRCLMAREREASYYEMGAAFHWAHILKLHSGGTNSPNFQHNVLGYIICAYSFVVF